MNQPYDRDEIDPYMTPWLDDSKRPVRPAHQDKIQFLVVKED